LNQRNFIYFPSIIENKRYLLGQAEINFLLLPSSVREAKKSAIARLFGVSDRLLETGRKDAGLHAAFLY